jgi:hypothetical protein
VDAIAHAAGASLLPLDTAATSTSTAVASLSSSSPSSSSSSDTDSVLGSAAGLFALSRDLSAGLSAVSQAFVQATRNMAAACTADLAAHGAVGSGSGGAAEVEEKLSEAITHLFAQTGEAAGHLEDGRSFLFPICKLMAARAVAGDGDSTEEEETAAAGVSDDDEDAEEQLSKDD